MFMQKSALPKANALQAYIRHGLEVGFAQPVRAPLADPAVPSALVQDADVSRLDRADATTREGLELSPGVARGAVLHLTSRVTVKDLLALTG
jgi:hypothetical protein